MLIGQISDFHVTAGGRLAYGRVDTAAMLGRAVAALNRVEPAPDLVIGSGDLVQHGTADEYAALREILTELKAPFAPVAGNHDHRGALARAFSDLFEAISDGGAAYDLGPGLRRNEREKGVGPDPFIQYALDLGDLRLVVIDTVTERSDEPSFCRERADWLDRTLSASSKSVVIAMHHPPFDCGVGWLEAKDPGWSSLLAGVLERHPRVERLLAGHVHRAIQTSWQGIPASTAPSTAHQVFPSLDGGEPRFSLEAPGFQLHRWTGGDLVTYTASTVGFGAVFPVSGSAAPAAEGVF